MAELQTIASNIQTQDNLATAIPIFIVQQRKRIYGISDDYTDQYIWVDSDDHDEVDAITAFELDIKFKSEGYLATKGYERVGYVDEWEFVTACFTRHGCEEYLKVNGHNLKNPRIYVASGYRNAEWEAIRNFFLREFVVVCSPAPFLFSMGISRLLNPEYFAFRDILRML